VLCGVQHPTFFILAKPWDWINKIQYFFESAARSAALSKNFTGD
jgi:hypothetical protein